MQHAIHYMNQTENMRT